MQHFYTESKQNTDFAYFNQAKIDNVSGICSLAALQYYNITGVLKYRNLNMSNLTIHINANIILSFLQNY